MEITRLYTIKINITYNLDGDLFFPGVIPIENVLYQSHNLPQITDRRAGVTDCTTGGRSNTMDGPVVVSYSAPESENDQEVFNEYLGIKIYKLCIKLYNT